MRLVPASALFLVAGQASLPPKPPPDALAPWEKQLGWSQLFDGKTLAGWHAFGQPGTLPAGWSVDEGALRHEAGTSGGDLVSDRAFTDFELEFEWRVASGANSGVKYRFRDDPALGSVLGPEYQILDDAGHADGARPETSAAALYALYPAEEKPLAPAGEWNRARIVSRGTRLEHWLNGKRVLAAEVGSADWETRRAKSKFATLAEFGRAQPSPIALQDHGDAVWFRNLRIRDPSHPPGKSVSLFAGSTLEGWKPTGDARASVEDGVVLTESSGGKGFLVSERSFGDFVLELEVRIEEPGNSGIQLRSRVESDGTLTGYQIEIDPSARSWSGGLYYEGRDWLQTLEQDEQARHAFQPGEWNRYRIECAGPVIRAFVNGIPTCDFRSATEASGVIALQVHDANTRVRWRELCLWELAH